MELISAEELGRHSWIMWIASEMKKAFLHAITIREVGATIMAIVIIAEMQGSNVPLTHR